MAADLERAIQLGRPHTRETSDGVGEEHPQTGPGCALPEEEGVVAGLANRKEGAVTGAATVGEDG
jgi:hypothetical protein